MSKGNKKSAKSKGVRATASDRVVVGLDVHKKQIHAAVRVNGQEVGTHVLPACAAAVEKFLAPYRAGLKHVVYEAGPTGYGLARHLRSAGMSVDVIAPSKTPQAPGDGSKSDRLDCRDLARLDEAHLLHPVAVPTEEEEADRQLIRMRDQAADLRRKARQRIKSFLLMHALPEPHGLEHWSQQAVAGLGTLEIKNSRLRFCLDLLLEELANAEETIAKIEHEMKAMAQEARHAPAVKALTAHAGVGRTTALAFETEMYQPRRFSNERQVSAMLGLAPRVRQSGDRRHEGPLIKAGRGRLRALLVEAAWVWIRHDPEARKVYRRLVRNTGSVQKAIVGMARRLGLDLWRRLVKARAAA
jgi:transposase